MLTSLILKPPSTSLAIISASTLNPLLFIFTDLNLFVSIIFTQHNTSLKFVLKSSLKNLFITCGAMAQKAIKASDNLLEEGIESGVLHMHTVKPLDTEILKKWLPQVALKVCFL